jgi:hypothetical protein
VKAGAAGYVLKDASGERLLGAVRRTLEGESPLNQELAMRLLVRLSRESGGSSGEGTGGGSREIWEGIPRSQRDDTGGRAQGRGRTPGIASCSNRARDIPT